MFLRHPTMHVFLYRGPHATGQFVMNCDCPGDDLGPPEATAAIAEFPWAIVHEPHIGHDGALCCVGHADGGPSKSAADQWAAYCKSEAYL